MSAPILPSHPLADQMPGMLTDEYIDLVNDIKANGLRQPLTLFEGKILDGRHRAKACAELGIIPDTVDFTGSVDEAKAIVLSLNVHRRHLTYNQKCIIVDAELKRDPYRSDRAIARAAKVDNKTVAKARAEAERREEIPHVTRRSDSKGRAQPATKPRQPSLPSGTTNEAAVPADEPYVRPDPDATLASSTPCTGFADADVIDSVPRDPALASTPHFVDGMDVQTIIDEITTRVSKTDLLRITRACLSAIRTGAPEFPEELASSIEAELDRLSRSRQFAGARSDSGTDRRAQ